MAKGNFRVDDCICLYCGETTTIDGKRLPMPYKYGKGANKTFLCARCAEQSKLAGNKDIVKHETKQQRKEKSNMKDNFIEISASELAALIGGVYFNSEEDLSKTEDLISYLENHPEEGVFLNINK